MQRPIEGGSAIPVVLVNPDTHQILGGAASPVAVVQGYNLIAGANITLAISGNDITIAAAAGGGAPVGVQYVVLAADVTLTDERVLAGTANQVILTDGGAGGAITLSLPQDIATTSVPMLGGLNISANDAAVTPHIVNSQDGTGDAASRFVLNTVISYAIGIDNSVAGDPFKISTAASANAVLGTGDLLTLTSAGDLTVTGDLAVNGGDLTTTATTFNLVNTMATTINIGGAATQVTITTTGVGIGTTGPSTALDVVGVGTFSSNLAVNGGSITATAPTANLFNTTATTLNIGGAATSAYVGVNASTLFGPSTGVINTGGFRLQSISASGLSASGLNVVLHSQSNVSGHIVVKPGWADGSTGQFQIYDDFDDVNVFTVDLTGKTYISGNVGIGTTGPTGKLDILGTLTVPSGASAVLRDFWMEPATITILGSTNITTAAGFNFFEIGIPTYSNASIVLTVGATLYVAGPPALSGGMTATNLYAFWIDDGMFRYDATTQSTVGAAGGASALPATPTGYFKINLSGTDYVVPYYAVS